MDAERWERVQTLFHRALDLPPGRWREALLDWCDGDESLVADVLPLLTADEAGLPLLDGGVAAAAHSVLNSANIPLNVGPYTVRALIGEGGMGTVYLADREDLGSRVAIKVLRDAALSPSRRIRFAVEQRLLAQLEHPGIARLLDAAVMENGTPYFVMEYVDGCSLTKYCARHEPTARGRLGLFRQACEAVLYAHQHAIVHRDLKPSNILVRGDGVVKLLDFGISKRVDPDAADYDATRTALRLMTPAYAAPEQLRGEGVGVYTDVYALGVILYELLTGVQPFHVAGRTPSQAESHILEREAERPSHAARRGGPAAAAGGAAQRWGTDSDGLEPATGLSRRAWSELDVICMAALQKDRSRRYASVEALLRDLDRFQLGEPLEARPDSLAYRADRFVRRNARSVAAGTAAAALFLSLSGLYATRIADARGLAVAETARTERVQRFMLDLFSGGDLETGPADTLRVVTLLERGVREAGLLHGEPAVQAELYSTLGGVFQRLGELERADTLITASLDLRSTQWGAEHPETARSLVALALLRADQNELDEAERLVRDALAVYERAAWPTSEVARAHAALGRVLSDRGQYDEAVVVLEQSLRQARHSDASPELAGTLSQLANAHFYAGRLDASDSLNRQVLVLSRAIHGDRHPNVADDLINLGAAQFERGAYVEAEAFYTEALEIFEGYHGAVHPQTASALTMLGRALVAQSRYDDARAMLLRALDIRQRVFGPDHPRVASTLNELGTIALAEGDYAAAEASYQRMAGIYRAAYGDSHYLLGIALSNLGSVYFDSGDPARAEGVLDEAVQHFVQTLSPDHINTGIARIKLGRALLRLQRFGEAESQLLQGHEVLQPQVAPESRWLRTAGRDLASLYDLLDLPDRAAHWRAQVGDP